MSRTFSIAGRAIGASAAPYIIGEMSANHKGELARALDIMERIAAAGADAIKLQTYTADTMTIDCDTPDFRIEGGLWDGYRLYELYQEAQTPWEWHEALFEKGRDLGITVFSTPFDDTAVDFLESLGAPAYKIASFEATDIPLIKKIASTGKPIIASTGLADIGEIAELVETARAAGCKDLALLHCVSSYPAPAADANLRTIAHLADTFDLVTGLSDHTMGSAVSVAGVALGAAIIERHVTLARSDGGADAAFSMESGEFAALVGDCEQAWQAIGNIHYDREESEQSNLRFRRSIYAVKDIAASEKLTHENIRVIRPGFGLAPKHLDSVLGQQAEQAILRGTALSWAALGRARENGQ
jgi:pseudaminic acid synthase